MRKSDEDDAMAKVRADFEKSGLTLAELGVKMGFPEATARMAAFQALKAGDPRISTLRRFAKALGISIEDLVAQKPKGKEHHGNPLPRTKGRSDAEAPSGRKESRADQKAQTGRAEGSKD